MAADHALPQALSTGPQPASLGVWRIAVVEDYEPLCRQLVAHLKRQGHAVRGVDCGEALDALLLAGWVPQLLVLDLNLPLEDGLSIAQRMRRAYPDMGIVLVTVRRASAEREAGYRAGADIVLPKPMEPSELSAAIAALQRRLRPAESVEAWRVDAQARLLRLPDGRTLTLTHAQAQALAALARAPQQRLHHQTLAEAVSPAGAALPKQSLEVCFSRLRAKLSANGVDQALVKAVRGWGYACCVPLTLGPLAGAADAGRSAPSAAPAAGVASATAASPDPAAAAPPNAG